MMWVKVYFKYDLFNFFNLIPFFFKFTVVLVIFFLLDFTYFPKIIC